MERGIVYRILAILVFLASSSIIAQNGVFTFDGGTENESSGVVTETIDGVTVTISQSSNSVSLLNLSGLLGTSGKTAACTTASQPLVMAFSSTVNISTIHIANGKGIGRVWRLLTNTSDSTDITVSGTNGVTQQVNFANIDTLWLKDPNSVSSDQFVVDSIKMLNPLPVVLTDFTAASGNSGIELNWQTATEVNNYGFEVQRREIFGNDLKSEWDVLGFVPGHGNSNSPKSYEFIDENPPKGNLEYRLKQIDTDGSYEYYGTTAGINNSVTAVSDDHQPDEFGLSQNYPNPFNPTTTIEYQIPFAAGDAKFASPTKVKLIVYDVLGKEVATLVNASMQQGKYSAGFNGADLPSGMYFYRLTVNGYSETRKMTLIK